MSEEVSLVPVKEKRVRENKPPTKESEDHRKMRAAYLAMGKDRSIAKVASQFGYAYLTVQRVAKAFNWYGDAKERDSALNDEFVELHRKDVNLARNMLFYSILADIKRVALRRGIVLGKNGEPEKLDEVGMKEVLKGTKEELKKEGIDINGYREMNDLLNALKKVVYEWQPSEITPPTRGVGGFAPTVKGNLNVQLIIEK